MLFKNLKDWIQYPFQKKKPLNTQSNIPIVKVEFVIHDNLEHRIDIKWSFNDNDIAELLGRLLFLINEGAFVQDTSLLLKEIANNPDHHQFVQTVVNTWTNLFNQKIANMNTDEPVVQPNQFMTIPFKKEEE